MYILSQLHEVRYTNLF